MEDEISTWAIDCIVCASIVHEPSYPVKPDIKDLAKAIRKRDERIKELEAEVGEYVDAQPPI